MTRNARRIADPCVADFDGRGGLFPAYLSIFCDNVQIDGAAVSDTPPGFIVRTLAVRGGIVYSKSLNEWSAFVPDSPRNRFGFPKTVRLVGDGGRLSGSVELGDDFVLFPANATFSPVSWQIARYCDTLDFISNAIFQNVDAIKQCALVTYTDESMRGQLENANRRRLKGESFATVYAAPGTEVKVENLTPNGAKSFLPDFMNLWSQTRQELDEITGRATVNEKNERRINAEMTLIENAASATIDTLINTGNEYAKMYGVDVKFSRRSVIVRNEQAEGGQGNDGRGDPGAGTGDE